MKRIHPSAPRGFTTLTVTLVLVLVLWLSVAAAHRGLLFEHKTSTNQYRATQAFEAAEAGLEWAIAQLNGNTSIDANCQADAASARSFADRYLSDETDTSTLTPRLDPSTRTALQAACVKLANAWSCSCPASGSPDLPAASSGSAVSFAIQFEAGYQPGVVQLVSRGCSGASVCTADVRVPTDARARLQVALARLHGLDSEPAAALTVRGSIHASTAFAVENSDAASGGMTVHSGAEIDAPHLVLASAPGSPGRASAVDHDPALAALSEPGLFASVFRMEKAHWRTQPVVKQLGCKNACDRALADAIGADGAHPLIWLDGGLHLDTPLTLGTAERPVLLVADGPVQLNAAAVIHGVVYSTSADWIDATGAQVQGAVVIEGDLHGPGVTHIRHDASALQRLHRHTGTFARVSGSWRDF